MKIKLIDSWYDEESVNSYAKIRTDYGEFEGWSTLHEEDADLASKYAGCQYAETRAALKNCQKQIEGRASYNPSSVESRALRKQTFILEAEKKDWQSRYSSLSEKLLFSMNNRNQIVEKMIADKKKGD